ncbi:MAG: hypothetical protein Q7T54_03760 [Candidatus Levybacteria bacterium]|nr:hypothetical protein [Candidatus Levybacteria bacterium]
MERETPEGISRESWEQAGRYLRQAIVEISQSAGGQSTAIETISLAGDSAQILPKPESLLFLETNFPGSAEAIITRAEQIQQESFRQEKGNKTTRIFRRRG